MKPNPVKQKLRWGEVTYGTWLTMGDLTELGCWLEWVTIG